MRFLHRMVFCPLSTDTAHRVSEKAHREDPGQGSLFRHFSPTIPLDTPGYSSPFDTRSVLRLWRVLPGYGKHGLESSRPRFAGLEL